MAGGGPLEGVRVADFSRAIASPRAAVTLADLGADVVKVEGPRSPDMARFSGMAGSMYLMGNRNKRSLALDLSSEDGRAVARRLAGWADVLIESFRPGVMDRLGLGYEAMAAGNPRLVYASLVGYGSTGPGAGRGAFDGAVQAESGMMLATGEDGGPPVKTGPYLIDEASGAALAQAILVALFARERTGRGDRVEVSMLDTALSLQTWEIAEFTLRGEARPRSGNAVTTSVPGDVLSAADGDMFVCAFTDAQWAALCRIIGRDDLADDPDFARFEDRVRNRPALTAAVASALVARPRSEWRPLLEAAGMVVGEVKGYAEVVADPQVEANGSLLRVPVGEGEAAFVRPPYSIGGQRYPTRYAPAPSVGQHTVEVLGDLGYDPGQIEALLTSGAAAVRASP